MRKTSKVVCTSRPVIEKALLSNLSDNDKVALLLDKEDLDLLIFLIGRDIDYCGEKALNFHRDLKRLRKEVFGQ